MYDKARATAVNALNDMEKKGAYSNLTLNHYFKMYDLNQRDRGFVAEIVYGTIRYKKRIDYFIGKYSKTPIDKMSPWAKNIIRTAIYQIFYMSRVPDFAVVNEAVEIAKAKERKSSGFVNGILRNILRTKEAYNKIDIKDPIERLATEYSHPKWFVEKFEKKYGIQFLKNLMEADNIPPAMVIRVNTLKTSSESIIEKFKEENIESETTCIDECLILKGLGMIESNDDYKKGLFTIQDLSSMMSARVLDPKQGEHIIDVCSAPGGKTTHMAQLMNNKGKITAFDLYPHKIKLVEQNASRLGIDIIHAEVFNSEKCNEEYRASADKVLVDAPCSGLGLIRKKPEIRWTVTQKDITELSLVQQSILKSASEYVKPGGVLCYSTCTITDEENEEVLKKFLEENQDFSVDDIAPFVPAEFKRSITAEGYLRLYPNTTDTDGFFIARLRRK